MNIKLEMELPMGHRLQRHKGKCRFPHGHNYLVTFSVIGEVVETSGMVVDFSDIKKAASNIFKQFDHCMLLEDGDPFAKLLQEEYRIGDAVPVKLVVIDRAPTAENIALLFGRLFAYDIQKMFPNRRLGAGVEVRETSDSIAIPNVVDAGGDLPRVVGVFESPKEASE